MVIAIAVIVGLTLPCENYGGNQIKTHIITKDQLDKDNNYIGKVDLTDFDGHLESAESLGYVKFKLLKVKGYIHFKAGSGIEAGEGIEAGLSIRAKFISSKLRIFAGLCTWKLPSKEEQQIVVEKLESGAITLGELVIKNPASAIPLR